MKKLSKLRLTQLSKAELEARQMNALKGGQLCSCSCYYANSGGSSSTDNSNANYKGGNDYRSVNGCNQYVNIDGNIALCNCCDESVN